MRIKIELPTIWHFKQELQVRVYDLNYGNHVGNDTVLRFAHDLRLNYYKGIGHTEINFFGKALIQIDAAIEYKAQMFFADELIGSLSFQDLRSNGFDLYYIWKKRKTEEVTAIVKTGMLFFDYEQNKLSRTPEIFKEFWQKNF